MHSHGSFTANGGFLPDSLVERLGGIDFTGVGHQQMENGVFGRGQRDLIAVNGDGFGAIIRPFSD